MWSLFGFCLYYHSSFVVITRSQYIYNIKFFQVVGKKIPAKNLYLRKRGNIYVDKLNFISIVLCWNVQSQCIQFALKVVQERTPVETIEIKPLNYILQLFKNGVALMTFCKLLNVLKWHGNRDHWVSLVYRFLSYRPLSPTDPWVSLFYRVYLLLTRDFLIF